MANVIICDDDGPVRKLIQRIVEISGHVVVGTFATGQELIQEIEAQNLADAQVLICDYLMPGGVSGLQVIRYCQHHSPRLRCILLTSTTLTPEELGHDLLDLVIIHKPPDFDLLNVQIEKLVADSHPA